MLGSSPRAWGIQTQHVQGLDLSRFIPTCVGNTADYDAPCPVRAVHPHVRGEYYSLPALA